MVIFRENVEDMYSGVEFSAGSEDAKKLFSFLSQTFPDKASQIRNPEMCGYGIKPISKEGTERIIRAALMFAIENRRSSVTMVHKGNIMHSTEGAFRDWGYSVGRGPEFRDFVVTERESAILDNYELGTSDPLENARLLEPGLDVLSDKHQKRVLKEVEDCLTDLIATHGGGRWRQMVLLRDTLLETAFQQSLTRPEDFDIIATTNLNGQYLSDALSAQVGGTGMSPGANINYRTGHAVFEATHGTAPKYADMDKVNPGSMILSGELMLRFLGWTDAADLILKAMDTAIRQRLVTYDFARQMEDATVLKCSEFANALIERM
uniref:isocitrate dehydrogenase (NADP(+)) n=1 Tax=Hemiselmis andersenii TaxID=464988 RepID=A0A7S1EDE8_HEMAN